MPVERQRTASRKAADQSVHPFSREIPLLLAACAPRDALVVRLLFETGLTPGELVAIQPSDLDSRARTLTLRPETTKNGIARTLLLSAGLWAALATHARTKAPGHHLFSTRQSPRLSTRRVEQILADACANAGLAPLTPRELRTAYLTSASRATTDTATLRKTTGLRSLTKRRALSLEERNRLDRVILTLPPSEQALLSLFLSNGMSVSRVTQLRAETTQLTPRRMQQIVSTAGAKARIAGLTPSVLRETALQTIALEKGPAAAAEASGNTTTIRYTHAIIDDRHPTPTGRGGAP
jgi:integrase